MKGALWLIPLVALALGGCSQSLYKNYAQQGMEQYKKKDYKDAEQSSEDVFIDKTLMNLANTTDKLGKHQAAMAYGERAIKIAEKIYPPEDQSLLQQMQFVATLYLIDVVSAVQ